MLDDLAELLKAKAQIEAKIQSMEKILASKMQGLGVDRLKDKSVSLSLRAKTFSSGESHPLIQELQQEIQQEEMELAETYAEQVYEIDRDIWKTQQRCEGEVRALEKRKQALLYNPHVEELRGKLKELRNHTPTITRTTCSSRLLKAGKPRIPPPTPEQEALWLEAQDQCTEAVGKKLPTSILETLLLSELSLSDFQVALQGFQDDHITAIQQRNKNGKGNI